MPVVDICVCVSPSPQCPSNRVATVEDDECDCVVGPPGQRGLPGRMVAHTGDVFTSIFFLGLLIILFSLRVFEGREGGKDPQDLMVKL